MRSNKVLKKIDPKLLKIWGLHLLIFYPICSFLEDNLQVKRIIFKDNIDPEFWKVAVWSPLNGIWGTWEKFPFFIFMTFGISILLNFLVKIKFFMNYLISLLISYLIVYLVHHYNMDIFYYIIPSLIIITIIQMIIFRKEIFLSTPQKI